MFGKGGVRETRCAWKKSEKFFHSQLSALPMPRNAVGRGQ